MLGRRRRNVVAFFFRLTHDNRCSSYGFLFGRADPEEQPRGSEHHLRRPHCQTKRGSLTELRPTPLLSLPLITLLPCTFVVRHANHFRSKYNLVGLERRCKDRGWFALQTTMCMQKPQRPQGAAVVVRKRFFVGCVTPERGAHPANITKGSPALNLVHYCWPKVQAWKCVQGSSQGSCPKSTSCACTRCLSMHSGPGIERAQSLRGARRTGREN